MNILLIGGADSLINSLINKLNKEGHRVCLLTGSAGRKKEYEKVFETYNFSYSSVSLSDVFDSINPDVTIYMGAYDSNFRWENAERESVAFASSLINILMAYATSQRGRFVFLSSEEVYGKRQCKTLGEQEETAPATLRGMALVQAEELCENYRRTRDLDIVIARLDHLYNIPKNLKEVNSVCAKMCLEALDSGIITVNPGDTAAFLYEADAVEYVYRLAVCGEHSENLYNISNSVPVTYLELARMVQRYMGKETKEKTDTNTNSDLQFVGLEDEDEEELEEELGGIKIVKKNTAESYCVLSNQLYNSEFGMARFGDLENNIKKTATYMKRHSDVFLLNQEAQPSLWERFKKKASWVVQTLFPFVENLVCFIPFFMLNNRAVDSRYFANMDFYLLYVLLFAIVYGQQQATISAVLATAGYCFRQMYGRSGFDVMLDYNTYVWIAQLFILGLVVGYMRDQIKVMRSEAQEQNDYLMSQLNDIQDINKSNVRVKDALEVQIVNQNGSIGKLYNITAQLDQYTPEEVLFYAAAMLSQLMGSKDVAIYAVSNSDYARLSAATSDRAREMGNSIRYAEMEDMYSIISQRKVYINRTMDERYPLMANAIFEEDRMQLILMVWGISWEHMTLGQANLLTVVSYLIQNAVLRANRYLDALENQRYVNGTKVMEMEAFSGLVHAYLEAQKKDLTVCTLLKVDVDLVHQDEAGQALAAKLRQSDYIGTMKDGCLYALLSNTNSTDAQIVMDRFKQVGYASEMVGAVME